jgi:transposase
MPPLSDVTKPKRTVSLRKKSGKKPGGQIGRKGSTLEMRETAGIIENYYPQICENCGNELSEIPEYFSGRRQVIDLPVIREIVTEHRIYSKQCCCGHCTKSTYPEGVKAPISYGSNIQSLVAYLSARQYIPVDRMREFLSEILNVNLSEGGICYLLDKMANQAKDEVQKIKDAVMSSSVVGADETGVNINGENNWIWTVQNEQFTYIDVHESRGFRAILDLVGNRFESTTLITDCWPSYFKTNAHNHQICTAHLQRELIGLTEQYPLQTWTIKFNDLLLQALNNFKYKFEIIGGIIGLIGAYLYWRYVGCVSGTCQIKAN